MVPPSGTQDFVKRLLHYDARCLLQPDAAAVVAAVRQRIAVGDVAVAAGSGRGEKKAASAAAAWRAAAAAAAAADTNTESSGGSSSSDGSSMGGFAMSHRSSLATVAARARRASQGSIEAVVANGPLTLREAAYGSQTVCAPRVDTLPRLEQCFVSVCMFVCV